MTSATKKIRLTTTLPINEKHGCIEGAVFEVLADGSNDRVPGIWIQSLIGEKVKVLRREFTIHIDPLTLDQKQLLHDRLEKHDWYYMMADDGKAYRKGEVAHNELYNEVMGMGIEAIDMYDAFKKYMNSLPTSSPLPKPERPGGPAAPKAETLGMFF